MLARLSLFLVMPVLAALAPGCSAHVETALVDPAKFQFFTCPQLEREMKRLRDHAQELRDLQAKAEREPAGAFIARIAYEPDYLSTIGDMEVVEATAQEKDCAPRITAARGTPQR